MEVKTRRIMMPTALPYNPKPISMMVETGRKTRPVTVEFYSEQLTKGCPHCKSAIAPILKGKGIKPSKSRANFAGIFAHCKNDACPFLTAERYYYISPTCERINEFVSEAAQLSA